MNGTGPTYCPTCLCAVELVPQPSVHGSSSSRSRVEEAGRVRHHGGRLFVSMQARIGREVRVFVDAKELTDFIDTESRRKHPERYAPSGEWLGIYPGDTWAQKLAFWRRADEDRRRATAMPEPTAEVPA